MKSWLASIGAIVAGFIVTALASTAADAMMHAAGIFPSVPRLMSDPLFALAAAYRAIFTVAGGYVTTRRAPDRPMHHAWIWQGSVLLRASGRDCLLRHRRRRARPFLVRNLDPRCGRPLRLAGRPASRLASILRAHIRNKRPTQLALRMIEIYDFPHGARGLRAAWLCEEMGLAYSFVHVSFRTDSSYRALNPFGTVPFLRDGNVSMSESVAMMFYVAQTYGPTSALPPVDDARFARVLQFTVLGEASLAALMTPLLAVRFGAPADQKRNWSAVGIESRLKGTIGRIGDELGDRELLVGSNLTLADISVATALRIWSRGVGQELPALLQAYCGRLWERPACKRAVAAHG